jgi:hypothetical protein
MRRGRCASPSEEIRTAKSGGSWEQPRGETAGTNRRTPGQRPIDGKDLLHAPSDSDGPTEPPACGRLSKPLQRVAVELLLLFFFFWDPCGKPGIGVVVLVRWRSGPPGGVRDGAGALPLLRAVGAAQPVSRSRPLGPLASAVAVVRFSSESRQHTGNRPAPRQQEQRVS